MYIARRSGSVLQKELGVDMNILVSPIVTASEPVRRVQLQRIRKETDEGCISGTSEGDG
jgi:hypothetical protein